MISFKGTFLPVIIIEIGKDISKDDLFVLKQKLEHSFFNKTYAAFVLKYNKEEILSDEKQRLIKKIEQLLKEKNLTQIGSNIFLQKDNLREDFPLMLNSTLRSGTQIIYKGDVIVFGNVNPGAEIIAGRNIIVMGKLRGLAWAGKEYEKEAYIMALSMKSSHLRFGKNFILKDFKKSSFPSLILFKNGQTQQFFLDDRKIYLPSLDTRYLMPGKYSLIQKTSKKRRK